MTSPFVFGNVGWLVGLLVLFAALLAAVDAGRIWAKRNPAGPESHRAGVGAIEASLFALLGLMIAFTFAGATGRYEARRQLIIDESNAIRTAYRRLDLLPAAERQRDRALIRHYVAMRVNAFAQLPRADAMTEFAQARSLEDPIWSTAVAGCGETHSTSCATVLLPSLNALFDVANQRTLIIGFHPPPIIFVVLIGIALACSVMAGIAMGAAPGRNWFYTIVYAAVVALTIYIIIEIEYPRAGFIRLNLNDDVLITTLDQVR
jgi:hypothetical protein